MKTKSFAMLAMMGLVAASCAYIVPAMADNNIGADQDQVATPSDLQGGAGTAQNNQGMDMGTYPNNNNANNNSDQGSPDTASGDDDY